MRLSIPSWVWTAAAVILVLLGAYGAGGRSARRSIEAEQLKTKERARRKADEVAREVDAMDADAVRSRAAEWVRNGSR